jgi:hypothetical protein
MECCDGRGTELDRRRFLKTAAAGLGAATAAALPRSSTEPETLVAALYRSLTPEQRTSVAFPFDHPLRSKVDANWHVAPVRIGQVFTPEQRAMVEEIFRGLHDPEFVDRVLQHVQEDAGGLGNYSAGLFGTPGSGKFELVLTGRHCTARCDGDSVEGAAFGGPIFYGHAAHGFFEKPDHPGNVYWFQARRANEVFQALDPKQREQALIGDARAEKASATVELRQRGELTGLPVAEMSRDQRHLVEKVLGDLLLPFRKKDRTEAMRCIKAAGGVEALWMSFYKNLDVGGDGVWDVWQLESPAMVWYFRGNPHVHTWVNVRNAQAG